MSYFRHTLRTSIIYLLICVSVVASYVYIFTERRINLRGWARVGRSKVGRTDKLKKSPASSVTDL